jgi:hypothetical protein
MLHLYFGAFDIVLYLGGTYFALVLSKAICDSMDEGEVVQTTTTAAEIAPMQPIPAHLAAPVAKREDASVKVSINS